MDRQLVQNLFEKCSYDKLFKTLELYLKSLFNGLGKEEVIKLFNSKKITDSVYLYTRKCYELIEKNLLSYQYFNSHNTENSLETTENFYFIRNKGRYSVKADLLLFINKLDCLLNIVDPEFFKEEIGKLKELFKSVDDVI